MSDLSKQLISSIPITHMSRLQWIQFKDAIERLHGLEEENGRLKANPQDKDSIKRELMKEIATDPSNRLFGIPLYEVARILAAHRAAQSKEPKP